MPRTKRKCMPSFKLSDKEKLIFLKCKPDDMTVAEYCRQFGCSDKYYHYLMSVVGKDRVEAFHLEDTDMSEALAPIRAKMKQAVRDCKQRQKEKEEREQPLVNRITPHTNGDSHPAHPAPVTTLGHVDSFDVMDGCKELLMKVDVKKRNRILDILIQEVC